MTTLNIEADEVLYRCAFASQKIAYKIRTKSGSVRDVGTKYTKTKIKKMFEKHGKVLDVDYTLESYVIAEPIEFCLSSIKRILNRLEQYGDLNLWLTASNKSNFRFKVAKTKGPKGQGYKAGRPPRPQHYQQAREYLINVWKAVEIEGYEADDALSMYQTNDTIAVHIDKDINMVPGKHLNWVTDEFYDVPEDLGTVSLINNKIVGRGLKFFYHQLLTGDATDNILGVPGIGPKTAYVLLKDTSTEEECKKIVCNIYEEKFGDNWKDIIGEMASLLWMVRSDKLTGEEYLNL